MTKNRLSPWTEEFLHQQDKKDKQGENEGKIPAQREHEFFPGYKVTSDGQVINRDGKVMKRILKPRNQAPYVSIFRLEKSLDGKVSKKYKEHNVVKLMRTYFGKYIDGYGETQSLANRKKEYSVVPKDDDRSNITLTNLMYRDKHEARLEKTVKQKVLVLLRISNFHMSDQKLAELFDVSVAWINKQRNELKKEGFGDKLLHGLGLKMSLESESLYRALLLSDGQKSNLVLAKELWPQEDWADKENKEHLLDKIVRVRKKLMDKGLIQKYNTYGKETNVADVRSELLALLQENKQLPKEQRKTHAAIAELLGLDKDQVDNFSRSLKKTPPPSQQLKAG